MSGLNEDLRKGLRAVAKDWKKAKRRADQVHRSRLRRMRERPDGRTTIRDAAFEVMEQAYNHASSNGTYYANARQIMYAARPLVIEKTRGECWTNSAYFTQTLLKDYLEKVRPVGWKVVWDARGHFHEPHTGRTIDLGGIAVMEYRTGWQNGRFDTAPAATLPARIDTKGPGLRYSTALFVEKEGFHQILSDAGLPERYDLALFSSKGVQNQASCDLASALAPHGVRILVLHDFDLAGFKIMRTMHRGTRLSSGIPDAIDLGLRLTDVEAMGLQSEPVEYGRQRKDPRLYLRLCGATDEEIAFLVSGSEPWAGWSGDRVEINAMTSEELITWLEAKLEEHGIQKVVPDEATLARAYQRAVYRQRLEQAAVELANRLGEVKVPDGLEEQVRDHLKDAPADSWDDAVASVVARTETLDKNGDGAS